MCLKWKFKIKITIENFSNLEPKIIYKSGSIKNYAHVLCECDRSDTFSMFNARLNFEFIFKTVEFKMFSDFYEKRGYTRFHISTIDTIR